MNNVFLVEDHDEVLKIWRSRNIHGFDLVHLDAHIDFAFYQAKPIKEVIATSKSVSELKRELERTLNFLHYEKDFHKQTDVGNYIYQAIEEGIVKNFYWVVPGKKDEFEKSGKTIKNMLKEIVRYQDLKEGILEDGDGIISVECLGRKFMVCSLDNLPVLTRDLLLDIDIDFLVIDSILSAENTRNIGKRRPWISPLDLVSALKEKIKNPKIISIAYSVNGGWTPMKYRHLGDELAYNFSPLKFKRRFQINYRAAQYFDLFQSSGKKEYYQKAALLNPAYLARDNNYGPLFLLLKRFSRAKEEFRKILKVNPKNPHILLGLGEVALGKADFKTGVMYFQSALRLANHHPFCPNTKKEILFNLGRAQFGLKNYNRAKESLLAYRRLAPLDPEGYFILGCIFEEGKKFSKAATFYKDALRLGFGRIEPLFSLLRISSHLKNKDDIIKYIGVKYRDFKKELIRLNRLNLKRKKIKGLIGMKKRMFILEKKLKGGE